MAQLHDAEKARLVAFGKGRDNAKHRDSPCGECPDTHGCRYTAGLGTENAAIRFRCRRPTAKVVH